MIKELEEIKYNFEEQKRRYTEITKGLSIKQKQELLEELLETDLWSYFQLITEILFDIASDNEDYMKLLEKVYLKVKNDMASAPFFNMLVDLGQNKKDIGIKIYNKIQGESNNEELKVISGLILGGYSMNDNTILEKLLEDKKLIYPITNTILKAVMVKSERLFDKNNNYKLSEKEYKFLDFVSQADDERFLRELMNLFIFLNEIKKNYFYNKIKELMRKKKSNINRMFWIRRSKLKLSSKEFFELAELTKDCGEYALRELIHALVLENYNRSKGEVKNISELLIYWINKDLEFKITDFDWALEELNRKNEKFLDYFLDNYKKIGVIGKKSLDYNFLFPRIFERLVRHRAKESISKLLKGDIIKKNPKLFYNLSDKIIGIIYKTDEKEKTFKIFLPLAKKIQKIAEKEKFINDNKKSFKKLVEKENFDKLIDYVKDLLHKLIFRKRDFDFDEIYNNLSKFKKLEEIAKVKLEKLEKDKKYSPMFWLLSQQRDKELKGSYLQEIENFIVKSETIENEKSRNNIRELNSKLGNEGGFWNIFSEIIFANKFIPNYNSVLEPKISNKDSNADLSIELHDKQMFFELVNPEMNRNVLIDNGAVAVRNKLDDVIRKKSGQFFSKETFEKIKSGETKDLFFIVVDSSSSMIDEYMIEDSFYGSLGVQFYVSTKGNVKTPPSKTIRKDDAVIKNKEFISGLVYFKPQLVNLDGEIKFILTGDIINNPDAINKITPEDYKKLKKIIFGK